MRIAVVGAGAIGSAVAATLAAAGRDVVLIARGERLRALRMGPQRIVSDGKKIDVPLHAAAMGDELPKFDLSICCVKMPDVQQALAASKSGVVLTLQNGVEAHEIAARMLPDAHIAAGRVHGFFEIDGDVVRHVGVEASILFGCTNGDPNTAEQAVHAAFAQTMFPVEVAPDIRRSLWEKFLLAACLGSVAAALDLPAGTVLTHKDGEVLLRRALAEVVTFASARKIEFGKADVQRVLDFIARFPPEATTSLQRDIAAGRTSEHEALGGAVLRIAAQHGIPHPTFELLDRMIRARMVS